MAYKKPKVLSWDYDDYVPSADYMFLSHTREEMESEYKRLSRISKIRATQIKKSEFADSKLISKYERHYNKNPKFMTDSELAKELAYTSTFINKKESTVTGIRDTRDKTLKGLNNAGYDFVNKDNFDEFVSFMEDMREKGYSQMYDSDRAAEWFEDQKKSGKETVRFNQEQFEKWLEVNNK